MANEAKRKTIGSAVSAEAKEESCYQRIRKATCVWRFKRDMIWLFAVRAWRKRTPDKKVILYGFRLGAACRSGRLPVVVGDRRLVNFAIIKLEAVPYGSRFSLEAAQEQLRL